MTHELKLIGSGAELIGINTNTRMRFRDLNFLVEHINNHKLKVSGVDKLPQFFKSKLR